MDFETLDTMSQEICTVDFPILHVISIVRQGKGSLLRQFIRAHSMTGKLVLTREYSSVRYHINLLWTRSPHLHRVLATMIRYTLLDSEPLLVLNLPICILHRTNLQSCPLSLIGKVSSKYTSLGRQPARSHCNVPNISAVLPRSASHSLWCRRMMERKLAIYSLRDHCRMTYALRYLLGCPIDIIHLCDSFANHGVAL